jgi:hypothetical protein
MFSLLISFYLLKFGSADNSGECNPSMFTGDGDVTGRNPYGEGLLSCKAQRALQRNWFPDPIGGLFSYQV